MKIIRPTEQVHRDGYRNPLLLPCADNLIAYNAERAFTLTGDGVLRVNPSPILDGLVNRSVPLCLSLRQAHAATAHRDQTGRDDSRRQGTQSSSVVDVSGFSVTTTACGGAGGGTDFLFVDGRVTVTVGGVDLCLAAHRTDGNATCPPNSFYTDPSATGACQSSLFSLVVENCSKSSGTAQAWTFDRSSRRLQSDAISGRCLAAVPRAVNNKVAVAVAVQVTLCEIDPNMTDTIPSISIRASTSCA